MFSRAMFSRSKFSRAKFFKAMLSKDQSPKVINRKSLLTDSEIAQLINAAPTTGASNSNKAYQYGRIGDQISSGTGSGTDFAEVRAYQSGDDPRHIDWRATARSQIPLLRTYHNELSQPLCLLIDRRSSMRFATRVRLKVSQALRMALFIGGREARLGREISAVLLDSPCHWLPPQPGLSSLKQIAKLANTQCPPYESELQDAHKINWNSIFSGLRQHVPQGSDVILLSDFSGLQDEHNKMLRMLGQHCSGKAIQVFDPSEVINPLRAINPLKTRLGVPTAIQLQWQHKIRNLDTSDRLNEELKNHFEIMAKRFRQANMDYLQLSVEQNELDLFTSGQYQ